MAKRALASDMLGEKQFFSPRYEEQDLPSSHGRLGCRASERYPAAPSGRVASAKLELTRSGSSPTVISRPPPLFPVRQDTPSGFLSACASSSLFPVSRLVPLLLSLLQRG